MPIEPSPEFELTMYEAVITIREALSLPVFSGSKLVAGQNGIDNPISWVHIVDIPEASYEWQRRGVLLLTAGYGLRDDHERQAALIPTLVEQGFAGMVLATGYYFEETPQVIREAADSLNFPVIEAPRTILFIEVTEAILERIVNRQYGQLQQASAISDELTGLVLQGANLEELAATLAKLIGRSVTIEDATFRVIANAEVGPVDEARRVSVALGRTSPELAQRLLDAGIYSRLLDAMGPIYLPPMPETGLEIERLIAPIIVDREIYGYIWIIVDGKPLTELDTRAITHGATVAALMLFKDRAVRRAAEALRGDFLERLLESPDNATYFDEQAQRAHFRADRPHQVLTILPHLSSGGNYRTLLPEIENWLAKRGVNTLSAWRGSHLVLVLEVGRDAKGEQLANDIFNSFNHPGSRILVGVGRLCTADDMRSGCLIRSYHQAYEAIRIGQAGGRAQGVVVFEELGLLHWLYHLPPQIINENKYLNAISLLNAYDRERNSELLKTLGCFLDNNGSLVETAKQLYIHRNTLLHRLERIRSICRMEIRSAWERLNLFAALKAYELRPSSASGGDPSNPV
jgi:PucR family transcriptional regulator, purine catabolism regulatory protein